MVIDVHVKNKNSKISIRVIVFIKVIRKGIETDFQVPSLFKDPKNDNLVIIVLEVETFIILEEVVN